MVTVHAAPCMVPSSDESPGDTRQVSLFLHENHEDDCFNCEMVFRCSGVISLKLTLSDHWCSRV
jgi:hypothetical protein